MRRLLANAYVVVMDDAGTEHESGWIQIEDGRVTAVGGSEPPGPGEDLGGAVVTPGLVNTHHHLYQTLTRARAQEATLFEWLVALYPVCAQVDAESQYAAARTGLAELALSGCSTRAIASTPPRRRSASPSPRRSRCLRSSRSR